VLEEILNNSNYLEKEDGIVTFKLGDELTLTLEAIDQFLKIRTLQYAHHMLLFLWLDSSIT